VRGAFVSSFSSSFAARSTRREGDKGGEGGARLDDGMSGERTESRRLTMSYHAGIDVPKF